MGLGVVILVLGTLGLVVAVLASVTLRRGVAYSVRGVANPRQLLLAATVFPFLWFAWGGAVFVFQAIVNELVLHRDAGIGDSWQCPLPNGYAILMVDMTDVGTLYNPRTQPVSGGVGDQADAVSNVRAFQVAGRYLAGGTGSAPFEIDSFFLLDAHTGDRQTFANFVELRAEARRYGFELHLEPIHDVYLQYRFTWFDLSAGFLFVVPSIIAFGFLLARILRARRGREASCLALD